MSEDPDHKHRWFLHPTIVQALTCPSCGTTMLAMRPTEVEIVGHSGVWDVPSFRSTKSPRLADLEVADTA